MIGALFPSLHSWLSVLSHNSIDKSMGSSFVVWGREDNCWHGFGGVFVVIRRYYRTFVTKRNEFCCPPSPDFSLGIDAPSSGRSTPGA